MIQKSIQFFIQLQTVTINRNSRAVPEQNQSGNLAICQSCRQWVNKSRKRNSICPSSHKTADSYVYSCKITMRKILTKASNINEKSLMERKTWEIKGLLKDIKGRSSHKTTDSYVYSCKISMRKTLTKASNTNEKSHMENKTWEIKGPLKDIKVTSSHKLADSYAMYMVVWIKWKVLWQKPTWNLSILS